MTERDAVSGKSLRESEVGKVTETASSSVIRHSSVTTETLEVGVAARPLAALSGHSTRTCGGFGGRRINGEPCSQAVPEGRERCPWHPAGLTPQQEAENRRELASRGGVASHAPKRAPGSAPDPRFDEPPKIIRWCERTAGAVARGEYTDYKGLEAQLKLARLALDALGIQALDQLDKLEQLVRTRLQRGAPA